MLGMDDGPGTDPGSLGFYLSALGPDDGGDDVPLGGADGRRPRRGAGSTASAGTRPGRLRRSPSSPATCSPGPHSGSSPTSCSRASARSTSDFLSWERGGRYVAAAVIACAAVYQLTPLKDVCLSRSAATRSASSSATGARACRARFDGRRARRLVHRLLLGADGDAVRARADERRPGWCFVAALVALEKLAAVEAAGDHRRSRRCCWPSGARPWPSLPERRARAHPAGRDRMVDGVRGRRCRAVDDGDGAVGTGARLQASSEE